MGCGASKNQIEVLPRTSTPAATKISTNDAPHQTLRTRSLQSLRAVATKDDELVPVVTNSDLEAEEIDDNLEEELRPKSVGTVDTDSEDDGLPISSVSNAWSQPESDRTDQETGESTAPTALKDDSQRDEDAKNDLVTDDLINRSTDAIDGDNKDALLPLDGNLQKEETESVQMETYKATGAITDDPIPVDVFQVDQDMLTDIEDENVLGDAENENKVKENKPGLETASTFITEAIPEDEDDNIDDEIKIDQSPDNTSVNEVASLEAEEEAEQTEANDDVSKEKTNETEGETKVIEQSLLNSYREGVKLPEERAKGITDGSAFVHARASAKWPIRCFADLTKINVNAKYGGCAALFLVSCAYGGKDESTSEVFLLGCGFDRNHYYSKSLIQIWNGHFGPSTALHTDEEGGLYCDCLFGDNFISVLPNDPSYCGKGCGGLVCQTGDTDDESFNLPYNMIEDRNGGTSMILCSAELSGAGETEVVSAVYVLRTGRQNKFGELDDNKIFKKLSDNGTDKWKFGTNSGGQLTIAGPKRTKIAIYHNRTDCGIDRQGQRPNVMHFQAYRGNEETIILDQLPNHGLALVLCSTSHGTDSETSSALYMATMSETVKYEFVQGVTSKESADLWTIFGKDGRMIITGPSSPCRYGVFCNTPSRQSESMPGKYSCLATGKSQPIRGSIHVDMEAITGWVSDKSEVRITVNEVIFGTYQADQLIQTENGKFAFQKTWEKEESKAGIYLVRVYAIDTDTDGENRLLELDGSPFSLIRQPERVTFAINCGGQIYQALNGIIYESEHRHYVNYGKGPSCKALGGVKYPAVLFQQLNNTHDGFLYGSSRSTGVEADDEKHILYEVPGLKNGEYKLRLHYPNSGKQTCVVQGKDRGSEISKQLQSIPRLHDGYLPCLATIPVTVTNQKLTIRLDSGMICAFALMESDYEDPVHDDVFLKRERDQKQKLLDSATPMATSLGRKKLTIAGWSQNLLQNASGESGNLSHWNYGGTWDVQGGGYETEKAFVSSHMWCSKYQEVDLTKYFSEKHLDTAPEIQIHEWYHEGCCGGGFYKFEATLLNAAGDVVKKYNSGEIGTIYSGKWAKEGVSFKDYGPGVRMVGLESQGKDDKFWGGHYGTKCAAACIRVKSEVEAAENDVYDDLDLLERDANQHDQLALKLLTDNAELLAETGAYDAQEVTITETGAEQNAKREVRRKTDKRKNREIRVFVSSTFRDFKREREHLIKKTFRELNRICSDRNVFFTYVDLRWGITTEQTKHGRTIAICLQEIDRCRPYFICLMGDRYGWSQKEDEKDKTLDQSFDYAVDNHRHLNWLDNYRYNTSVTKLEVLYAALLDTEAAKSRSFFYLRESPDKLNYLVDPQEVEVYTSESEWHHDRQYDLRRDVTESGLNIRAYESPEEVCELIKRDLESCVEEDFPIGTELTLLERERDAHMAFAEARRRVYIGRGEYFDHIQTFVGEQKQVPLVILGESGSGKSALIANWVAKYEEANQEAFVFVHFIGSSAESASHTKLLRRLMEELKLYFDFDMAVPSSDSNLIRDFPAWLRLAGSRGKVVIVLDALNQLDSGAGGEEQDLLWLPRQLPPGVCVVLTTLVGRAFDAVTSAGWPTFPVHALKPDEKEAIITGYLEGIYGKTLTGEQKQNIIDAPQSNNPLYLRALLDELRVFGDFGNLGKRLDHLLSAEDPSVLFGKILERLEQDFEKGQDGREFLVRDTTAAIWCSHRGMSEEELLQMLNVPSAIWSPFYLSLDENLINRNGIVNFFHDHLRQAVEARYLPTAEDKQQKYGYLAAFFESRESDDRVADELPYLLAKAGDLTKLRTVITKHDIFRRLMKTEEGKFDLIKWWQLLGDYTQVESAYLDALADIDKKDEDVKDLSGLVQSIAEFFIDLGLYNGAKSLYKRLLSQLEAEYLTSHSTVVYCVNNRRRTHRCNHPRVIDNLFFYCRSVLLLQGDPAEAKRVFLRAKEVAVDALTPTHQYVAAIIGQLDPYHGLWDYVPHSFPKGQVSTTVLLVIS
uniref:Uncharacterized protein LOC100371827 n=1 Tax=Saccoglossus kowalevskii TaxID=10224 RepID=A0ABM0MD05_SACKO|nr:PREDICTED: uncharacterized protein LOC100371827 [Saccoglossus kowalevskii]